MTIHRTQRGVPMTVGSTKHWRARDNDRSGNVSAQDSINATRRQPSLPAGAWGVRIIEEVLAETGGRPVVPCHDCGAPRPGAPGVPPPRGKRRGRNVALCESCKARPTPIALPRFLRRSNRQGANP